MPGKVLLYSFIHEKIKNIYDKYIKLNTEYKIKYRVRQKISNDILNLL